MTQASHRYSWADDARPDSEHNVWPERGKQ